MNQGDLNHKPRVSHLLDNNVCKIHVINNAKQIAVDSILRFYVLNKQYNFK